MQNYLETTCTQRSILRRYKLVMIFYLIRFRLLDQFSLCSRNCLDYFYLTSGEGVRKAATNRDGRLLLIVFSDQALISDLKRFAQVQVELELTRSMVRQWSA